MSGEPFLGAAISEEILGDGAAVPLQGGLVPAMEAAAGLGLRSVELHVRDPLRLDRGALLRAAERLGLSVSAIGTGLEYSLNKLSLTSPDPEIRRRTAARYREHIDLAGEFGAAVFLGMCRGSSPDFASRGKTLDLLAGELLPVVEYAQRKNVTLALEPIAFYLTNLLNTTGETLSFLDRPGFGPVRLLVDTHHMFIEDPDIPEALRLCRGRIAHAHMSDSNRRSPGSGRIDFGAVLRTLRDIGYEGALSLEILPFPDGTEALRRGIRHLREAWALQS